MRRIVSVVAVVVAVIGAGEASAQVRPRPLHPPQLTVAWHLGWGGYWGPGWGGYWSPGWRWYRPAVVAQRMIPPNLAEIDLNVRPKHARILLDGRLIGPAGEFDGFPGYLYLEPGSYGLQVELGGYRAQELTLQVRPGERYDVKLRLERVAGTAKERWWESGDGEAVERVYGPLRPQARAGADASLRPDLRPREPASGPAGDAGVPGARAQRPETPPAARIMHERGRLVLTVNPSEAAVYLDGEFLATGAELARLERGVAVPVGRHRVEVVAPGYAPVERELEIDADRATQITIELLSGG